MTTPDISNDMLKLNDIAINVLKDMSQGFTTQPTLANETMMQHLKKTTPKFYDNLKYAIQILSGYVDQPKKLNGLPIKLKARREYLDKLELVKKFYNSSVNIIRNITKSDSPLQNLLFVSEHDFQFKYIPPKQPHFRKQIDFLQELSFDSAELSESKLQLSLSQGSTRFDSPEQAFDALSAYIERTTVDSLICTRTHYPQKNPAEIGYIYQKFLLESAIFKLKISFKNTKGIQSYVLSDSTGIIHVLTNGVPPRKAIGTNRSLHPLLKTKYKLLIEYNQIVKKRLIYLIGLNNMVTTFPYRVISCCRLQPSCTEQSIIMKCDYSWNNLVQCSSCKMDLCADGCGKIHHGLTPCDVSVDEASELTIKSTTKQCPGCIAIGRTTNVFKYEGCNHMVCTICSCEFCYKCEYKFRANQYGKYDEDITLHYASVCAQFDI